MNLVFATIISLIVLGVSFYPALMAEHKKRHDIAINKKVAASVVDEVLARYGKKRDPNKTYRVQVMPDGRGILRIYNKDKEVK